MNHHCPLIRPAIWGLISWGVGIGGGSVPLDSPRSKALHSLKLTIRPLKIGLNAPQRKPDCIPTIHFQVHVQAVSFREGKCQALKIWGNESLVGG